MPRGNPSIWKTHGASYAELAGTTTAFERAQGVAPRQLPPVPPASIAEMRASKAAGVRSLKPHSGVGSFVLQSTWSLGVAPPGDAAGPGPGSSAAQPAAARAAAGPGPSPPLQGTSRWAAASGAATGGPVTAGFRPRSYTTETKSHYGPPPSDFRRTRSAGPPACQFPKPDMANDWKTTQQVDFRPEVVAPAPSPPPPPPPFKGGNAGPLLPSDVPKGPQHFLTQHRAHFPGRSLSDSQAIRASGCRATQAPGYNIITGAVPSYVNNAFEHFDARDYRRHR